ncbi:MAG: hypothetical protein LQ350_008599 [Teloschistes chrysophthalmus]|nr:MAG: hypothetical protein LQ350_008599 [Niorma chrysophthalma]
MRRQPSFLYIDLPNRYQKKGRPSYSRIARAEEAKPLWKKVACQRLFPSRHGSHYFEVLYPDGVQPTQPSRPIGPVWEQAQNIYRERQEAQKQQESHTIERTEKNEVNPWLERSGWHRYLKGLDPLKLMESVEDPDEETEPVLCTIWKAMDQMIRHCQQTVIERVGLFIRMEAVRTEKHQTRYYPLQGNMNAQTFGRYSRPWKQLLMFFGRTLHQREWKVPKYQLRSRQAKAWKHLINQAKAESQGNLEDRKSENTSAGGESEKGSEDEEALLQPLPKACLGFCISLLDEQVKQHEYHSAMVCALAVLGVKKDGWLGADRYPSILSAMIKISRFMVVQDALEAVGPAELEYRSDSSGSIHGRAGSQVDMQKDSLGYIKQAMDQYMVRGSHSPMQWMLDLRTYGLKISYNTTSEGRVDWVEDQILYQTIQFTMAELRGMIHGLVAQAQKLLCHELLMLPSEEQPPRIPWSSLRDNPVNQEKGWNFIQDERNPWPVDGDTWLWNRVGRDRRLQQRFIQPGGELRWQYMAIKQYLGLAGRFLEKLLVLCHLTGGQPARAPEILSIRQCNTRYGDSRDLFIEDRMVVLITRYHKGYAISGSVKVIHRYLPRAVGELMIWYLWLFQPFHRRIRMVVWDDKEESALIWPGQGPSRPWTSLRMSRALQDASQAGIGVKFGLQVWRQLAIGISRRKLQSEHTFREDDEDEDGDFYEDEAGEILDLQSGHSSHVAGIVYARGIHEIHGVVASKRKRFRGASIAWHDFLGFVDEAGVEMGRKRRAEFEFEAEDAAFGRWKRLRQVDMQTELRGMLGEEARFRGIQSEALEAIRQGQSPVVVVMGTGGGKSLLFMLPAWISRGGTTVVVVPLIALRQDLIDRCRQVGIPCAIWKSSQPADGARIVLVTSESAVGEAFATFLNRLKTMQQLDRIVMDECHTVLNEKWDFRRKLQRAGELGRIQTQMVLLTATLPPSKEAVLWERMEWQKDEVRMFQQATNRKNMAYRRQGGSVLQLGSETKELADILGCEGYHHDAPGKKKILDGLKDGDRMVVATSAFGMGIDVADIRLVVHADEPRTLLDYAQESGRAGRDGLPSEAIIIIPEKTRQDESRPGPPDGVLVQRFVGGQECQRAVLAEYLDGITDRTRCESDEERCMPCRMEAETTEPLPNDIAGRLEANIMQPKDANRSEEVGLADRDDLRVFQSQGHRQQVIAHRRRQRIQDEVRASQEFREYLDGVQGRCPYCIRFGMEGDRHALYWCRQVGAQVAKQLYKDMKTAMRQFRAMEPFSGCVRCFAPQAWCERWVEREKMKMIRQAFQLDNKTQKRVLARFEEEGLQRESDLDHVRYLGRRIEWGGLETNILCRELATSIKQWVNEDGR